MKKLRRIVALCIFLIATALLVSSCALGQSRYDQSSNANTTDSSDIEVGKDMVTIYYEPGLGRLEDGELEAEVERGSVCKDHPTPNRNGYTFTGWYIDEDCTQLVTDGNCYREDETTLYAGWVRKIFSNETITIAYDTGLGRFDNMDDYERKVEKDTRNDEHPTPIHDNPAMKFDGWYLDSEFDIPLSASYKFSSDTYLYAKWTKMTECADGGYTHRWSYWDTGKLPTCEEMGTQVRYCYDCNFEDTTKGDPPKGHDWSRWQEAFMREERHCKRTGCNKIEKLDYENITVDLLGDNAIKQIKVDGEYCSENSSVTSLFDDNWKEPSFGGFASNGQSDTLSVMVTLLEPTTFDRVYFKGRGVGSVYIQVLYQGDSNYTPAGVSAFVGTAEDSYPIEEMTIPYAEIDTSRAVVAVRFLQNNPPNAASVWEEFAFVRIGTKEQID